MTALRAWQAQIGAGVELFPQGARVDDEDTVVLLIRALGLWVTLPCRVVYVDETPERFAFAYGTLPGHPERGEVRFAIERDGAGAFVFRIVSFSRTVDPARPSRVAVHPPPAAARHRALPRRDRRGRRGGMLVTAAPDGSPVELYAQLPEMGEGDRIAEAVPAGCSILELGCGTGRITRRLVAERSYGVRSVNAQGLVVRDLRG